MWWAIRALRAWSCRAHYNVRGIPVTHDWRLIFSLGHASRLSRFEATAPLILTVRFRLLYDIDVLETIVTHG
jgi:hypothetical protein